MVLVDTSIWSLAYRRKPSALSAAEGTLVAELRRLAGDDLAALIGPIRFELLSGIREAARFQKVQGYLSAFHLLPVEEAIYDLAAEFYNRCRTAGVAPGSFDMLIAASAAHHGAAIFTTDGDFARYAEHLPVRLHRIAAR